MGRSYQLGMLATAGIILLSFFLILVLQPFPGRVVSVSWSGISIVAVRGAQTKNLSNAKNLATGCKLYALDHDDRFPMHLSELEPDYIAPGTLVQWRCVSVGHDGDPKYTMDWLYFGAGFNKWNAPTVLIASPQASTTGKTQTRVVIHGDTSGVVIKEDRYQEMLAETVKQMRALDDARHPTKPASIEIPQNKVTK